MPVVVVTQLRCSGYQENLSARVATAFTLVFKMRLHLGVVACASIPTVAELPWVGEDLLRSVGSIRGGGLCLLWDWMSSGSFLSSRACCHGLSELRHSVNRVGCFNLSPLHETNGGVPRVHCNCRDHKRWVHSTSHCCGRYADIDCPLVSLTKSMAVCVTSVMIFLPAPCHV